LVVGCLCRRILLFLGFRVSLSGVSVGGFWVFVVSWFSGIVVGCWLLNVGVGEGALNVGFLQSPYL
jgi:hypothetical protein